MFRFVALLALSVGLARTESAGGSPLPVLNVRLAPPSDPMPRVRAEIDLLEGQRRDLETARSRDLDRTVDEAIGTLKGDVQAAVARSIRALSRSSPTSLLSAHEASQVGATPPSAGLELAVFPQHEPDAELKDQVERIEQSRATAESGLFEQAIREVRALGRVVVHELKEQLQRQVRKAEHATHASAAASFLQSQALGQQGVETLEGSLLPPELDVRLSASSVPFPTVAGLVRDMEGRRDSSEGQVKQQILAAELRYLRAANELVRDACRAAVDQLLGKLDS